MSAAFSYSRKGGDTALEGSTHSKYSYFERVLLLYHGLVPLQMTAMTQCESDNNKLCFDTTGAQTKAAL